MEITASILPVLILLPFLGFMFILMVQNNRRYACRNVIAVAEFTVLMNILMLWLFFSKLDLTKKGLQFTSTYLWTQSPRIEIGIGIDIFSLMILLAVHMVMVVGLPFLHRSTHPKRLGSVSMLLLSILCGLLLSVDIFSFYICFTAMPILLILLMSGNGEIRKSNLLLRFFIYNFMGGVILLLAVCALYYCQKDGRIILLNQVAGLNLPRTYEYWIWSGIFIALLSRIPIWPFHYWISSVTTSVQNPLVFLILNLFPLTGIYGLIRFCPKAVPESVSYLLIILEIIAAISMLFISLIGLINKDYRYKLFSFMTVYYIIFLQGSLLPTGRILLNIGYSIFAFLVIVSALEVISAYIREEQEKNNLYLRGILCQTPRLSFLYSFFTLAAVGFPLSALFVNNFVLLSYLFSYNYKMGLIVSMAMVVASTSLLKELYTLKDTRYIQPGGACITDIPKRITIGMGFIAILLIISFFNPLLLLGA